jgi:AcrR family transcriptional regulator
MSSGQPDSPARRAGQPGAATAAPGDLTARARIREAAIRHFANEGYERTTIRGIAATAGVSPGLLRHHFGSKEELRRACDEHIAETIRRVNAAYLDDLTGAAADRRLVQPFERYIVRALAENSPSAAAIFDEMVTMTEHWLERASRCCTSSCRGRSGPTSSGPTAGVWSPSACSTSTLTRSSAPKTPPRGRRESTDRAEPGTVR